MDIKLAESATELERCFPVIGQLRTNLYCTTFIKQVQVQRQEGYHLAYGEAAGKVVAIAGFRMLHNLFRGRFIYIDDLVTDEHSRSQGYGDALLDWVTAYGRSHACQHLELDSGVQRASAHRFYFRKRMVINAYHFTLPLE